MSAKKASTSKKKTSSKGAASTAEKSTEENVPSTPVFKEWRIEKLADVAQVDQCQIDKVLYFLGHSLRKCRIMNETLIAMNYHERGSITLETVSNDEPEEVEVDPLG